MKKTHYTLIMAACFAFIQSRSVAQKLPSTQNGSIWAPAAVKVDGKLTEWGDLQAYNKNVRLFYTIANDDKNLYLSIRSTDQSNNNKILAGGISLALNTEGRKRDKDAFVVTFPVIDRAGNRGGMRRRGGFGGFGGPGGDDKPDSAAILAQQRETLASAKQISAIGFKDITDTLVSIYNEYGLKAVANIDNSGNYIYELAIPLKMLNIQPDGKKEIAYNIKVNGLQLNFGGGFGGGNSFSMGGGGGGGFGGGGGGRGGRGGGGGSRGGGDDFNDMMTPTDFWGKYILATGASK